jgi:hypothetical protein
MRRAILAVTAQHRFLLARQFTSHLPGLSRFATTHVVDEMLKLLDAFLKADHGFCRFASGGFLSLFRDFHRSPTFLELCRTIADADRGFKAKLTRIGDRSLLPAIMRVNPELYLNCDDVEDCPSRLLYDIFAIAGAREIPERAVSVLQSRLASGELPGVDLLPPLMKFAPCEVMSLVLGGRYPDLPPERIGHILAPASGRASWAPYESDLVRYATASKSIGLITLLASLGCRNQIDELLVELGQLIRIGRQLRFARQ